MCQVSAEDEQDELREALKRTAVALKQAEIPFALGGGYAAWAHGGPEPSHDVDFVVAAADVSPAQSALEASQLRVEQPAEDWLFKVYDGDAMVDVLHRIGGKTVERSLLDRAIEAEVLSIQMPVLSATDVLSSKLNALNEQKCDYSTVLPVARALREQVDWDQVAQDAAGNDFAEACLFLLNRLGVAPGAASRGS